MANTSLNLVDLDFYALKNNFKNFLRNQPQYKDFDFNGSNMSVLLDVLAYNTFKNAFYTNMLFSEGFLDSAQLRGSVVSHAKELNYLPRSAKSSRARIKIDFEASGASQPYNVPKGSTLSTIVKNTNYTFTIPETIQISSSNTSFSFTTDIYEGIYVKDTYIYKDSTTEVPRFRISNKNVDLDSLTVVVYADGSSVGQTYTLSRTLLGLNSKSKVFFLQASETEYYEIFFGDDIIGMKPDNYSTIVLDYRLSSGEPPNGAIQFALNFNPTGAQSELLGNPQVTTIQSSADGAPIEDIESIRYYAPRSFQVQERCITASDYAITLQTQFPEINAIYAYGGEELTPPQFGRVFVAVDITGVDGFPENKRRQYYEFVKKRSAFAIEPIFVEPEYMYLSVNTLVRYNINVTKVSEETFRTFIKNTILDYNNDNLDNFNVTYRNSKLVCAIDDSDASIVSSVTAVNPYKKIAVDFNNFSNYVVNFGFPLVDNIPEKEDIHKDIDVHAVYSSPFTFNGQNCIFEDNGSGIMRIMQTDGTTNRKIINIGTVDYATGVVRINNFKPSAIEGNSIKIYCVPNDADVSVVRNTILTVEPSEVNVKLEQVRI